MYRVLYNWVLSNKTTSCRWKCDRWGDIHRPNPSYYINNDDTTSHFGNFTNAACMFTSCVEKGKFHIPLQNRTRLLLIHIDILSIIPMIRYSTCRCQHNTQQSIMRWQGWNGIGCHNRVPGWLNCTKFDIMIVTCLRASVIASRTYMMTG